MGKRKRKQGFEAEQNPVFEEEIEAEFLPLSNVMAIVRSAIPEVPPENLGETTVLGTKMRTGKKVKFSKCFQDLLQSCVADFIHIIATKLWMTSRAGLTTFTDEDILQAMESLGIDQYSTTLRLFMNDYREMVYQVLTKRLNKTLAGAIPAQQDDSYLALRDA
jgi:hypothetical protein